MKCSDKAMVLLNQAINATTREMFNSYRLQITDLKLEVLVDPETKTAIKAYSDAILRAVSAVNPLATMKDPVLVSNGQIYPAEEVRRIFSREPYTCPVTGDKLCQRIQFHLSTLQGAFLAFDFERELKELGEGLKLPPLFSGPSSWEGGAGALAASGISRTIAAPLPVPVERGGAPRLTVADAAFAATVSALKASSGEMACTMKVEVSRDNVSMLFINVGDKAKFHSLLRPALFYKLPRGEIISGIGYGVEGWGRCWSCTGTNARLKIWFPEGVLTPSELDNLIKGILEPLALSDSDEPAGVAAEPISISLASVWAFAEAFFGKTMEFASSRGVTLNNPPRVGGAFRFLGTSAAGGAGSPLTSTVPSTPGAT